MQVGVPNQGYPKQIPTTMASDPYISNFYGNSFSYQTFGINDGTWSNSEPPMTFLSGYSGHISGHDPYPAGIDGVIGGNFGGGAPYNYFHGNTDGSQWIPGSISMPPPQPVPQQEEGHFPDQPPAQYYRPHPYQDGMTRLEAGMDGLALDMEKEVMKENRGPVMQPKTWASIASLPPRPHPSVTHSKKKNPGMPPPPIIPGKHHIDDSWDSKKVPGADGGYKSGGRAPWGVIPQPPPARPPHQQPMLATPPQPHHAMPPPQQMGPCNVRPPPMQQRVAVRQPQQRPQPEHSQPESKPQTSPVEVEPQHNIPHQAQHSLPQQAQQHNLPPPNQHSLPPQTQHSLPQPSQHSLPQQSHHNLPPHQIQQLSHQSQQHNIQPQQHHGLASPQPQHPILQELYLKNNYNPEDFDLSAEGARFFVIKSYSEDDIHRSIKYEIWCSTDYGNKRLDQAFRERENVPHGCVYLFFSVNGSGHFCGMARMMSAVDYSSSSSVWCQDKWKGQFQVRWIYVKDVPNTLLRHIKLENNENKPVTNSRDTQEVPFERGRQVLKVLHDYKHCTSIFDDFIHYERKQLEEDHKKQYMSRAEQESPSKNPSHHHHHQHHHQKEKVDRGSKESSQHK